MSCIKGLFTVVNAGIGAFFGAIPATQFVDVSKNEGAIIGASLVGTVTVVLFNVADKIQDMTAMKKTCLALSAFATSYFVGILVGVNVCLKAGYDTTFSEAVRVTGWAVVSAAVVVTGQFVVGGLCMGTCFFVRKCNRLAAAAPPQDVLSLPPDALLSAQENRLPA